jgi:hypothetical protein
VSNEPNKTEPPNAAKSPVSPDSHRELFASWLKLTAIADPQARAKGMSELVERLKQIEQADKGQEPFRRCDDLLGRSDTDV